VNIPNHLKESFVAHMSSLNFDGDENCTEDAWIERMKEGAAAYMAENGLEGSALNAVWQYADWAAEFEE
jgi:hypothetical protein